MMMDSSFDYSNFTIKELKALINADDGKALEEFVSRSKSGTLELKNYTKEQLVEMISRDLKTQMKSDTEYSKLTSRELKHLMGNDPKADEEYDRRVKSGEIKTRRVTFDDIAKMYGIDKSA